MQNDLLHELESRGFINQCSNMDALIDALAKELKNAMTIWPTKSQIC